MAVDSSFWSERPASIIANTGSNGAWLRRAGMAQIAGPGMDGSA